MATNLIESCSEESEVVLSAADETLSEETTSEPDEGMEIETHDGQGN